MGEKHAVDGICPLLYASGNFTLPHGLDFLNDFSFY
jgi:hypothetical protein